MSRLVPWRNKPTPLITQMIPVAKELKLYLVNQIGPTNLVLKDQNQNKFKVIIGDTINCSCGVVKNDHCIHSLFVLLKKFKVSENHPIIWQASYVDSQLDGLTQHKYQDNGKSKTKTNIKQFLKKKKQVKQQQQDDFPPLDQQQMCPVCYEQMTGQCYSTCQTCHKSLHTKCFKVWTKHKEDSQSPVTCPMCRTKFINPTKIIFRDLQKWESRFSTHKKTVCKGCGVKNIKGLIYKCLVCSNSDLCKLCYQGNQHLQHQIFCVKQLSTDKWKLAPIRAKKTRKQLFQPIQEIDLKQLTDLQSPEFIFQLLPTFKQYNFKQAKSELGIVGNEMFTKNLCTKCHSPGGEDMIRLACSHPIHSNCLKVMIQSHQPICLIDNQIICPGYWSAIGVKITKPTKKSGSDLKFIRNNQQISLLQKKNVLNQTYQPTSLNKKQQRNISLGNGKDILGGKQIFGGVNRISGMKMKEVKNIRPPTIPKKTNLERKRQIQSLSIGGLGVGFGMSHGIVFNSNINGLGTNSNIGQLLSNNNFVGARHQSGIKAPPKMGLFSNKNITHFQR